MKPLIVTTEHRGVFFGYAETTTDKTITLERARMCVYWDASLRGVVGLATTGPNKHCKVGPAATKIILQDITAIMEVTPEAEAAWNKEPWA